MRFINPQLHGVLDYSVAAALVAVPLLLGFASVSVISAVLAVGAGVALFVYSMLTDYSAGLRELIPFRVHLALDAAAALALIAAPFVFGFGGVPQLFYTLVGVAVLAVVAVTQPDVSPVAHGEPGRVSAS